MSIPVKVKGGTLSDHEIQTYLDEIKKNNPDKKIMSVELAVDGDSVDVKYKYESVPFHRIRRITGYLVGDLDRFNDAKRAEVNDRVKHSLGESMIMDDTLRNLP